jgi:hypothetical protein
VRTSKGREGATTHCELFTSGQVKAKASQGLKKGKVSGRGTPRQRAHSSKASRHKEIKNSKASRELLLYQVL